MLVLMMTSVKVKVPWLVTYEYDVTRPETVV
jgi:hypothetical protein